MGLNRIRGLKKERYHKNNQAFNKKTEEVVNHIRSSKIQNTKVVIVLTPQKK